MWKCHIGGITQNKCTNIKITESSKPLFVSCLFCMENCEMPVRQGVKYNFSNHRGKRRLTSE
jgi:hypothetical protein